MPVLLTVIPNDKPPWHFVLWEDTGAYHLGRSEHNEIRVEEIQVSRRHARFDYRDGAWWVQDLGSANGLVINGLRVETAKLEQVSEVRIGDLISRAAVVKTPAGARLVAVALGVALSACTSTSAERPTITSPPSSSTTIADPTIPSSSAPSTIAADSDPTPPDIRSGDLEPSVVAALDAAWADYPNVGSEVFDVLADSGDARLAWLIIDYLTFNFTADAFADTRAAFQALTGVEVLVGADWVSAVDHLISWDVPAFPGYVDYKRTVFAAADERWAPFFSDDSDADYRFWTWGGVLIDDSPPRLSQSCQGCIPGLDDPRFTTADDGDWYPDDRPVLGVEINGEARAYPLNIMEVHEMVNDTLGGRDFTLPYCTLCRSAQLYFATTTPMATTGPGTA